MNELARWSICIEKVKTRFPPTSQRRLVIRSTLWSSTLRLAMASTNTPELKVILCGEYGVGKTSILRLVDSHQFRFINERNCKFYLISVLSVLAGDSPTTHLWTTRTKAVSRIESQRWVWIFIRKGSKSKDYGRLSSVSGECKLV